LCPAVVPPPGRWARAWRRRRPARRRPAVPTPRAYRRLPRTRARWSAFRHAARPARSRRSVPGPAPGGHGGTEMPRSAARSARCWSAACRLGSRFPPAHPATACQVIADCSSSPLIHPRGTTSRYRSRVGADGSTIAVNAVKAASHSATREPSVPPRTPSREPVRFRRVKVGRDRDGTLLVGGLDQAIETLGSAGAMILTHPADQDHLLTSQRPLPVTPVGPA